MLNEKMWEAFSTIESTLIHVLPTEYQMFMFGGKIKLRDIIVQIFLACCEYAYHQKSKKTSLRRHRKQSDEEILGGDAMKGRLQRAAADMNAKNVTLSHYVKEHYGFDIKTPAYEQNQSVNRNKKPYIIDNAELLELLQLDEISLLKVILNRKFLSPKFYNDDFRVCADEYDRAVQKLLVGREENNEKMVLNTFTVFTLEWQYYIDFMYKITSAMEKNSIREIPDLWNRLTAFCYQPTINPALNHYREWAFLKEITVTSRAVLIRNKFVDDVATMEPGQEYEIIQASYLEALYLIVYFRAALIYKDKSLQEWFCKETDLEDWASVCAFYDISQEYVPDKIWSNKKIRYAKTAYKDMTFDYKLHNGKI